MVSRIFTKDKNGNINTINSKKHIFLSKNTLFVFYIQYNYILSEICLF